MSNEVTAEQLKAYEGKELSPSDWFEIGQERITQFAHCTDDHQYIHVDAERMKDSEFGCTIVPGFLSLSLLAGHGSPDWPRLVNCVMSLNYGLDRVRFLQPVRVNSRVRFRTRIVSVTEKSPGRLLIRAQKTLEIDGEDKPGMIAETISMLVIQAARQELE